MDPRATASGYSHTHFDSRGLNIPALSTFPSDDEIDAAAKDGAEEAESLLALLGVSPKRLQDDTIIKLPPIASLLGAAEDEDEDDNPTPEAQQLQDLISEAENGSTDGFLPLAKAAALVTADEFIKMYIAST
jgi:hypothetical protein